MRFETGVLLASAVATVAVVAGLGMSTLAFADEPIAPKLEVPSDARDLDRSHVEDAVVPSRRVVGVPAYPGSRVVRTTRAMQEGGDGASESVILPTVTLLTDADPETVAAWYDTELSGWKKASEMGMTFFHPEDVDLDLVHIGSHRLVAITPVLPNMPFTRLWPAAKAEITIAFEKP